MDQVSTKYQLHTRHSFSQMHFIDQNGCKWRVDVISHGRTSAYLNPKVHRPVVQFSSIDGRSGRRYATLPEGVGNLGDLDDEAMLHLFASARSH